MGRETVPTHYVWTCDNPRCKGTDTEGSPKPFTTSGTLQTDRPKGWSMMTWVNDDGISTNLLCPHCVKRLQFVNCMRTPLEQGEVLCDEV